MKNNFTLNITTLCNYKCSYCDVIKNNKKFSKKNLDKLLCFIEKNTNNINNFKFFGGEPLMVFDKIKYIIDNSNNYIGNNYEIVTNTSLLTNEVGEYFRKYFKIIFFSIDTENDFDYYKVGNFIFKYYLESKIYFNLIISPGKEKKSLYQFKKLYKSGFRNFNILPIYITKIWTKENLLNLSLVMKCIIDLSIEDNSIKLYGFKKQQGEESKLTNNSFFIDIDGKIYFSDIIINNFGKDIKNELFLGKIDNIEIKKINNNGFKKEKKLIFELEKNIYNKIRGQKELGELMNYFSKYFKINN